MKAHHCCQPSTVSSLPRVVHTRTFLSPELTMLQMFDESKVKAVLGSEALSLEAVELVRADGKTATSEESAKKEKANR